MPTEHTQHRTERTSLEKSVDVLPFLQTITAHGLKLERERTVTLQINMGLLCNQRCRHCHLDAGPGRAENMNKDTVTDVIQYAEKNHFEIIDVTGGAPELNPNLTELLQGISPLTQRTMLRSNLSALINKPGLTAVLAALQVVIVASFPSINEDQSNSQRGDGIFQMSLHALKKLNAMGYGQEGSSLELNLVSNPTGAFLPPSQEQAEKRFREIMKKKWGIVFNHLYNFANVPLGRFREWLISSGNLSRYVEKLASGFNPCAVEGLMCRTLVSLNWDGHLYDCDFNLARDLPMSGKKIHVSEMTGPPVPGSPIAVADHCYTCTAGAGFT